MPKLRDHEAMRATLLFGSGALTAKVTSIARETNIPASTIYRDRAEVERIPLYRIAKYAKARGLTDEEIAKLIRGSR